MSTHRTAGGRTNLRSRFPRMPRASREGGREMHGCDRDRSMDNPRNKHTYTPLSRNRMNCRGIRLYCWMVCIPLCVGVLGKIENLARPGSTLSVSPCVRRPWGAVRCGIGGVEGRSPPYLQVCICEEALVFLRESVSTITICLVANA